MANEYIDMEIGKDGKAKRPNFLKRVWNKICNFWDAIKGYVYMALMYIGVVFVCLIPYLLYYGALKLLYGRSEEKDEKVYTNEDEGFAVVLKRWLTKREVAEVLVRKKKGESEYDILRDMDVIKEDIA